MYWSAAVKVRVASCCTTAGTRTAKRSISRDRAQVSRSHDGPCSRRSARVCTRKLSRARKATRVRKRSSSTWAARSTSASRRSVVVMGPVSTSRGVVSSRRISWRWPSICSSTRTRRWKAASRSPGSVRKCDSQKAENAAASPSSGHQRWATCWTPRRIRPACSAPWRATSRSMVSLAACCITFFLLSRPPASAPRSPACRR